MIGIDDEERRARAALSRLIDPYSRPLHRRVATDGAAAVLAGVRRGSLLGGDSLVEALRPRLSTLDVDRDLAEVTRVGGRFVCPGDDEWPEVLADLDDRAPIGLWVRGARRLDEMCARSVSVVGSRSMSEYGAYMAGGLGGDLGDAGWVVISGGAAGIDGAAHRGCLAVGAPTVAVLACGVDVTYPRGHDSLFDAIAETGAIVSELPPGSAPFRHRFLVRNRLIAALSAGTVVVEAAVRSGARSTASEAAEIGRPLMVVPGPVTSSTSAGCHAILRANPEAVLVTCAAEVIELVGSIGLDLAPVPRGADLARDHLSPDVAKVLEALPVRRGQGPARIASTAGLPLPAVEIALSTLDLLGLAEQVTDGWRLAPPAR